MAKTTGKHAAHIPGNGGYLAEGPEPDVTLEYVQDTRMVVADLQAQINEIRNGGTT